MLHCIRLQRPAIIEFMDRISVRGIIHWQGKYLFVKNVSSEGDFFCLPGGRLEIKEHVTEALKREVQEELGVTPEVGQLLYVHQIKFDEGYSAPSFFFHVKNGEDFKSINIADTTHGKAEIKEFGFYDLDEVHLLPSFLKSDLPLLQKHNFEAPAKFIATQREA